MNKTMLLLQTAAQEPKIFRLIFQLFYVSIYFCVRILFKHLKKPNKSRKTF